jgi:hypothetical protein
MPANVNFHTKRRRTFYCLFKFIDLGCVGFDGDYKKVEKAVRTGLLRAMPRT